MKLYPKTENNKTRITWTQNGAVYSPRRHVSVKVGLWIIVVLILLFLSVFPNIFDKVGVSNVYTGRDHDLPIYKNQKECHIEFVSPSTGKIVEQKVTCEEYNEWLKRHSPNYRWWLRTEGEA